MLCQLLGRAIVLVREDQLSLAIGRRGQNVRLASKLVGWDIEIMTREELNEQLDKSIEAFSSIPGAPDQLAENLVEQGFFSFDDLSVIEPDQLAELSGLSLEDTAPIVEFAEREAERLEREAAQQKAEAQRAAREAEAAAARAAAAGGSAAAPEAEAVAESSAEEEAAGGEQAEAPAEAEAAAAAESQPTEEPEASGAQETGAQEAGADELEVASEAAEDVDSNGQHAHTEEEVAGDGVPQSGEAPAMGAERHRGE